jgi:hypothetical protein
MTTEQLSYFPGMVATIFLETLDGYGQRTNDGYDGYTTPVVTRIILPSGTLAVGYPQPMVQLDTGLYNFQFTLPTGAISIGSYLVDVAYINYLGYVNYQTYQIIVTAPFGTYSVGLPTGAVSGSPDHYYPDHHYPGHRHPGRHHD